LELFEADVNHGIINSVMQLPQGVTALVRLEELDVSNNDLTNVPPHIGLMTNLRSLQLDGNR
jgi:Leucine-rich repeat (LRR) protein